MGRRRINQEELLKRIYFNPRHTGSYGGVDRLRRAAHTPGNTTRRWLREQDTYTLHKPVRYHFKRRRVVVGGQHQQWQADLVDVSNLKKHNDGTTFLLTVFDVFSKQAWCVPLKNKTASSLVNAFKQLLVKVTPVTLQTDKGTEFVNRTFYNLLKERGIQNFSTHNEETKASVVERFNRTLKTRMWRYFTKHQTLSYIEKLPAFLHSYNSSYHRGIGMTPSQVNPSNQEVVWQRLYGGETSGLKPKLRVGDRVRISKVKRQFKKGYLPNWTEEIFSIREVHRSDPPVYRLIDDRRETLDGTFYESEVQKVLVTKNKLYRVEKVLRRRRWGKRTQLLVKWCGYPDSFNSWIDEKTLVEYKG